MMGVGGSLGMNKLEASTPKGSQVISCVPQFVCLFVFNYGLTCQLLTFSGPGAGCAGSLGRDGYVLPRSRQFAAFLSIFWHLQSLSSFYAVCSERRWYESLVYSCARTHHSFSASMQCTHQSLCLLPLTGKRSFSSQG